MKKLMILSAMLLTATLWSCKEELLTMYEGEANGKSGIFIQRRASYTLGTNFEKYADSSAIETFVGRHDTIKFIKTSVPVKVLGNVLPYDRPFILETATDLCINAVEGVDFEIDKSKCFVPAGKGSVNVPVTLIRTVALQENMATIGVRIKENDNFMIPFQTYRSSNNPNETNTVQRSATTYKMYVAEMMTAPTGWTGSSNAQNLIGDWTRAKFNALNQLMGWTLRDWDYVGFAGYPIQSGRMPYTSLLFQKHLQEMADKGTPVVDKDSDEGYVQLLPPYMVDYSKYNN